MEVRVSDSVAASMLEGGRDAYARHGWSEAFELLSSADAEQELTAADRHLANIRNKLGQPTPAATVAHAAKLGLL